MGRDELIEAIARCIDGDLSRDEAIALFGQLATEPDARELIAEAQALERRLADLGAAYDEVTPSAAFIAAEAEPPTNVVPLRPRVAPRSAWAAGLGAAAALAASLAMAVVVLPGRDAALVSRAAEDAERLVVLDMPFRAAADAGAWTHQLKLAPGQSARLTVQSPSAGDFHLRVLGSADLDVSLAHARAGAPDQARRLRGGLVRYAALRRPHAGDVLTVRNGGVSDVELSVAAGGAGAVFLGPAPAPR